MKQIHANCPTCGRAFPKLKIVQPAPELDTMTPEQRRAYFRKTAPVEDVRFILRIGAQLSDPLRADWKTLLIDAPTLTRSATYARLSVLQERWRWERNAEDPAFGSLEVAA